MRPIRQFLKRLRTNERGSVLILFGLSVLFLVGIGGAAIDLGSQQLMRVKFQAAADAAATSAASLSAGNATISTGDRTNAANRYFNLNYPTSFYNIPRPTPTVNVAGQTVTVGASSQVPTSFVSNFGIPTLPVNVSSTASLAAYASSDFDVAMVVDESFSESRCMTNLADYTCGLGPNSLMTAMRNAITTMANNVVPPGNNNPNVRMGFMGFSGRITNKWGLSSSNAHAMTAISNLRPVAQNFDHQAMLAGAQMLAGGTAGVANQQITAGNGYPTTPVNITAPRPRTNRTNPSDANGISPVKYLIFLSDGQIMMEPSFNHAQPLGMPDMYDPLVASTCPGRSYYHFNPFWVGTTYTPCYQAFINACTAAKNTGGTNNVHVMVIDFVEPVTSPQATALRACASNTVPGGATYSASVKPDPTKDFFFAPDTATLNLILTNITTQIQSIRITQ